MMDTYLSITGYFRGMSLDYFSSILWDVLWSYLQAWFVILGLSLLTETALSFSPKYQKGGWSSLAELRKKYDYSESVLAVGIIFLAGLSVLMMMAYCIFWYAIS